MSGTGVSGVVTGCATGGIGSSATNGGVGGLPLPLLLAGLDLAAPALAAYWNAGRLSNPALINLRRVNIDATPSFRLHRVWAVGHNSLTNGLRCQLEQEGTGEGSWDPGFLGKPRPHSSNRAGSYSRNSSPTRRSEERRVGKECRSRWSPY